MLEENTQFTIKMVEDKMLFTWKEIQSFTEGNYKYALSRIAFHCLEQTPSAIIIDKLIFQPNVSLGKNWYNKHVLPSYHKIEIQYLGHITGKVKGYKLLPISEESNFENIEFESLKEALSWRGNKT